MTVRAACETTRLRSRQRHVVPRAACERTTVARCDPWSCKLERSKMIKSDKSGEIHVAVAELAECNRIA